MKEKNYYENEYLPKMNRFGLVTNVVGVILCFLPAVTVSVVYGLLPKPAALLTAFLTCGATYGILWFVEPISYYTVLGPIGTYMTFLSGNASNLRIPCAGMAQEAAGVEPGTDKGALIATIGVAISVIINISVLSIGVIAGSMVLSKVPQAVTDALQYLLPALFGALLVQFAMKKKSQAIIIVVIAILLNIAIKAGVFFWLPGASTYLGIVGSVFMAIVVAALSYKRKIK